MEGSFGTEKEHYRL